MNKFLNNKIVAFTLAETLMTLAIIGVVAAITIPTLINSYQKQQYVTQLKKVYAEMSQAVKQLKNDREVDSVSETGLLTWDDSDPDGIYQREGQFLKQYFKIAKDCGVEYPNASACFKPKYKSADGSNEKPFEELGKGYSVVTAGGTSISMGYAGAPRVIVDLNGLKGPNTGGRDIFVFSIYHDGSIDEIAPDCTGGSGYFKCDGTTKEQARKVNFEAVGITSPYGVGCFGKILNDGWKMDY